MAGEAVDAIILLRDIRRLAGECFAETRRAAALSNRFIRAMKTLAKFPKPRWHVVKTTDGACFTDTNGELDGCDSTAQDWTHADSFAFISPESVREIRQQFQERPGAEVRLQRLDGRRLAMIVSDRHGRPLTHLSRTFAMGQQPRRGHHVVQFVGEDLQSITLPIESVIEGPRY